MNCEYKQKVNNCRFFFFLGRANFILNQICGGLARENDASASYMNEDGLQDKAFFLNKIQELRTNVKHLKFVGSRRQMATSVTAKPLGDNEYGTQNMQLHW